MIQKLVIQEGFDWILAEYLLKVVKYKSIEHVIEYIRDTDAEGNLTHTFVALGQGLCVVCF
jgi:hypothetical protein